MATKAQLEAALDEAKTSWEALITAAHEIAREQEYCEQFGVIMSELAETVRVPEGFLPIPANSTYLVKRRVIWTFSYDEHFEVEATSHDEARALALENAEDWENNGNARRRLQEIVNAAELARDNYTVDYTRPNITVVINDSDTWSAEAI